MISLRDFPRKGGRIQGLWRIKHSSDAFRFTGPGVRFRDGVGLWPLAGPILQRFVTVYGRKLESAEPWDGPLPDKFPTPAGCRKEVLLAETAALLEQRKARPKAAPVAKPASPAVEPTEAPVKLPDPGDFPHSSEILDPFDLDTASVDELREHCDAEGIEYDGRWGARRLRREIRKHGS